MNAGMELPRDVVVPPRKPVIGSLIQLYDRIAADPDSDIAPPGYRRQPCHYAVVLKPDGSLVSIRSVQTENDRGKQVAASLLLPDAGKRSGSGMSPFVLFDNTGYVLGKDDKDNPDRAGLQFEAFRAAHIELADQVGDEASHAVAKFVQSWSPEQTEAIENWDEICGKNLVFQLSGQTEFAHQTKAFVEYWQRRLDDDVDPQALCAPSLVDGKQKPLARLHPAIKRVYGAGTTGAAIVSFNQESFKSYGKTQSYNSPLGKEEAFKYTTVLNRMLADPARHARLGDTTVVFWTDSPPPPVVPELAQLFSITPGTSMPSDATEDRSLLIRLKSFLDLASSGSTTDQVADANIGFYMLGLAANKSRLSIRFWCSDTVAMFAGRLYDHLRDISIAGLDDDRLPTVFRILSQTVRDPKKTHDDVPPNLVTSLTEAMLHGTDYPDQLLRAVVTRCRLEKTVYPMRAAILRGCINRRHRLQQHAAGHSIDAEQNVKIAETLDEQHSDPAYHVGRVLANLDVIHVASTGGRIEQSATAKMFAAAIANPGSVLPRLVKLLPHHLRQIPNDPAAARANRSRRRDTYNREFEKSISRISHYPSYLPVADQAAALLGFYHQRGHLFRRSKTAATDN